MDLEKVKEYSQEIIREIRHQAFTLEETLSLCGTVAALFLIEEKQNPFETKSTLNLFATLIEEEVQKDRKRRGKKFSKLTVVKQ